MVESFCVRVDKQDRSFNLLEKCWCYTSLAYGASLPPPNLHVSYRFVGFKITGKDYNKNTKTILFIRRVWFYKRLFKRSFWQWYNFYMIERARNYTPLRSSYAKIDIFFLQSEIGYWLKFFCLMYLLRIFAGWFFWQKLRRTKFTYVVQNLRTSKKWRSPYFCKLKFSSFW